jgi:hypothetical protein
MYPTFSGRCFALRLEFPMDARYLRNREQTSLKNARAAKSAPARIAHEGLATAYANQIDNTVEIEASPSVPDNAPVRGADRWEDDGGPQV